MSVRNIEKRTLKSGETRYYVRATIKGHRTSFGGFRTLHEARAKLREEEGKNVGIVKTTLAEFYADWISAKEKTLKPSTLTDYQAIFRLHVLPTPLARMKLRDITPTDIQSWVNGLSKKKLSASSINRSYRCLHNCLNSAVAKDLIDRSPCRGVDVPRPKQDSEFDILSLDEVSKVLDAADEPERTLIAVLAYGGLRLAEALGLKWKDVDYENRCMRIERTYNQFGWGTPKTDTSRRAVPLSSTLAEILSTYKDSRKQAGPDDVVFCHESKRDEDEGDEPNPLDPSNVRRDFNAALKSAGIRHVSLHSLRHFYASNMIASGCSIKFLQHALGHSTATMTLNTYAHWIPESGTVAMAGFDARISGQVTDLANKKKQ